MGHIRQPIQSQFPLVVGAPASLFVQSRQSVEEALSPCSHERTGNGQTLQIAHEHMQRATVLSLDPHRTHGAADDDRRREVRRGRDLATRDDDLRFARGKSIQAETAVSLGRGDARRRRHTLRDNDQPELFFGIALLPRMDAEPFDRSPRGVDDDAVERTSRLTNEVAEIDVDAGSAYGPRQRDMIDRQHHQRGVGLGEAEQLESSVFATRRVPSARVHLGRDAERVDPQFDPRSADRCTVRGDEAAADFNARALRRNRSDFRGR